MGGWVLYVKPASGAGKEEVLKAGGINVDPWDWSHDGKFIVLLGICCVRRRMICGCCRWKAITGPHHTYKRTSTNSDGHFSPDGQFMAYVSNESGRNEVYVQTIPGKRSKVANFGSGRHRATVAAGREGIVLSGC